MQPRHYFPQGIRTRRDAGRNSQSSKPSFGILRAFPQLLSFLYLRHEGKRFSANLGESLSKVYSKLSLSQILLVLCVLVAIGAAVPLANSYKISYGTDGTDGDDSDSGSGSDEKGDDKGYGNKGYGDKGYGDDDSKYKYAYEGMRTLFII